MAKKGSDILASSYHSKEKSAQTDSLITQEVHFQYIFVQGISYKISQLTNQIKAAAEINTVF